MSQGAAMTIEPGPVLPPPALPPPALPRVARALVQPLRLLWFALAIGALVGSIGGTWRGWVEVHHVAPRFDALGLAAYADEGAVRIDPITRNAIARGVRPDSRLLAIDGAALPIGASVEAVSLRLTGRDGSVTLGLEADGARYAVALPRSAAQARALGGGANAPLPQFLVRDALMLIAALVLLIAGLMLIRRRPNDPVSLLLAFSFCVGTIALPSSAAFFEWLGVYDGNAVATAAFFALLIAALPAFPDGRFVPRRGGWIALLAAPAFLVIATDAAGMAVSVATAFVFTLAAAAMPVVRFRRTPPGLERQQLKWAGFGFAVGISLLGLAFGLLGLLSLGLIAASLTPWLALAATAMFSIGFLLLPMGVLVSLLRYRLWDVDRVIGKSSAIGIVTLLLGGLWAAMQELVKAGLMGVDQRIDPTTVAAVATAAVAVLFPPVQARVDAWTERRLQPQVRALRDLPGRFLADSQTKPPERMLETGLAAIVAASAAAGGDAWLREDGAWRPIAATGMLPGTAPPDADEPDAALFALDLGHAMIRLAPRPDGTPLGGDVRGVLGELAEPLGEALTTAIDRAHLYRVVARIGERLDRIEARLGDVELRLTISAA